MGTVEREGFLRTTAKAGRGDRVSSGRIGWIDPGERRPYHVRAFRWDGDLRQHCAGLPTLIPEKGLRSMRLPTFLLLLCLLFCILCGGHTADAAPNDAPLDFSDLPPLPPGLSDDRPEDPYTTEPFADSYAERRAAWMDFLASHPQSGPYTQLARLSEGRLPVEIAFVSALRDAAKRGDCSDFRMQAVIRLMIAYGQSPLVSDALKAHARHAILNYKYWPDEPGVDSMCSWSENHFIMFAAAGYLAGQLYPDAVFVNSGRTGREQMARFRPRVMKWMELRFKTGFSEWLSNVYYEEDLPPLLNLIALCEDEEIAGRARQVVDLLLIDMALNSYRGLFGSTHGRSYEKNKKWASNEDTRSVMKLVFGTGQFKAGSMAAVQLAITPSYEPPRVVYEMAHDMQRPSMLNRQRVGWAVESSEQWGLDPSNREHLMYFLAQEAYNHPLVMASFVEVLTDWNWFENDFFRPYGALRALLRTMRKTEQLEAFAWERRRDLSRNYRAQANLYTYRTADYMLSSAQDYRAGYGGDQQHVWQATLAPDAVCFTTHPAMKNIKSPSYWTGSGTLPRVAQVENVAMVVYNVDLSPGLYVSHECEFTHAWLPKDQFDAIVEDADSRWIFARKGDRYLALWIQNDYSWQEEPGEDQDREILVPGTQCIYICELGSQAESGSFRRFRKAILAAPLFAEPLHVRYVSPSQGTLEFGWTGKLEHNGQEIALGNYPRFSNPYAEIPYNSATMRFECNDEWLELDWDANTRTASGFMAAE